MTTLRQQFEDEELCPKCGEELFESAVSDNHEDLEAAFREHLAACPGPDYRGKLVPCPHCGSKDVDPEGWGSGGCQCPDADAHAVMGEECKRRTGPACDDCGATAESVEIWNTRV